MVDHPPGERLSTNNSCCDMDTVSCSFGCSDPATLPVHMLSSEQAEAEAAEAAAARAAEEEDARLARLREEYTAAVPDEIQEQVSAAVQREVDRLKKEMVGDGKWVGRSHRRLLSGAAADAGCAACWDSGMGLRGLGAESGHHSIAITGDVLFCLLPA